MRAALAALVLGSASAQTTLYEICQLPGPFSWVQGAVGDYDGDGVGDVMLGRYVGGVTEGHIISGATGTTAGVVPEAGGTATGLGDVDGDGVGDLLVGITSPYEGVRVVSGADLSTLHFLGGPFPGVTFYAGGMGEALDDTGDLTGDGVPDFVLGRKWAPEGPISSAGAVYLISGADASIAHTWTGVTPLGQVGQSVAGLGDVDGDGVGDIGYAGSAALVSVVSGDDGALIHTLGEVEPTPYQGPNVIGAGDVDGDGHADVAVGFGHYTVELSVTRLYSGADGALLWESLGSSSRLAPLGDLDGDGAGEIAAYGLLVDPGPLEGDRHVDILSGRDGTRLYRLGGGAAFAQSYASPGDLDGDGRADLVIEGIGEECPRVITLRPVELDSLDVTTLQAQDVQNSLVELEVEDTEFLTRVHVGELVLGPDESVEVLDAHTLSVLLPLPPQLGPLPLRVSNLGFAPSEAVDLEVTETHPPALEVEPVATTGAPLSWTMWAGAGDHAFLLISTSPTSLTFKGWPLMFPYYILHTTSLDAAGRAVLTVMVPAAAAGLIFTSQLVAVDTSTNKLAGTSNFAPTWIVF